MINKTNSINKNNKIYKLIIRKETRGIKQLMFDILAITFKAKNIKYQRCYLVQNVKQQIVNNFSFIELNKEKTDRFRVLNYKFLCVYNFFFSLVVVFFAFLLRIFLFI